MPLLVAQVHLVEKVLLDGAGAQLAPDHAVHVRTATESVDANIDHHLQVRGHLLVRRFGRRGKHSTRFQRTTSLSRARPPAYYI